LKPSQLVLPASAIHEKDARFILIQKALRSAGNLSALAHEPIDLARIDLNRKTPFQELEPSGPTRQFQVAGNILVYPSRTK